jgi:hypothetical protein
MLYSDFVLAGDEENMENIPTGTHSTFSLTRFRNTMYKPPPRSGLAFAASGCQDDRDHR